LQWRIKTKQLMISLRYLLNSS